MIFPAHTELVAPANALIRYPTETFMCSFFFLLNIFPKQQQNPSFEAMWNDVALIGLFTGCDFCDTK